MGLTNSALICRITLNEIGNKLCCDRRKPGLQQLQEFLRGYCHNLPEIGKPWTFFAAGRKKMSARRMPLRGEVMQRIGSLLSFLAIATEPVAHPCPGALPRLAQGQHDVFRIPVPRPVTVGTLNGVDTVLNPHELAVAQLIPPQRWNNFDLFRMMAT